MATIWKDLQGGLHYDLGVVDDRRALARRNTLPARLSRRDQAFLDVMNGPRKRENVGVIQAYRHLRHPRTRIQTEHGGFSLAGNCIADRREVRSGQISDLLGCQEGRRCRNVARALIDDLKIADLARLPEFGLGCTLDCEDPPGELFVRARDGIVDDKVERIIL